MATRPHGYADCVDVTAIRAHIEAHSRAGVGSRQLAELAGVNRKTIQCARTGNHNGRPQDRIRADTARKILAVPVGAATAAPHALVDATGSHRRIHALCAIGWGFRAQGDQAGWARDGWHRISRETRIIADTAALVRDVYNQLSMTPAPPGRPASRIRAIALRQGWFPPLAWDDDDLDDPAAYPLLLPPVDGSDPNVDELAVQHAAAGHPVHITPPVRNELIRRLTIAGRTAAEIAPIAHTSTMYVHERRAHLGITRRREVAA